MYYNDTEQKIIITMINVRKDNKGQCNLKHKAFFFTSTHRPPSRESLLSTSAHPSLSTVTQASGAALQQRTLSSRSRVVSAHHPVSQSVRHQFQKERKRPTSFPCCRSNFSHHAHTSPRSGSVAVARPNQSPARSTMRSAQSTRATVHTTSGLSFVLRSASTDLVLRDARSSDQSASAHSRPEDGHSCSARESMAFACAEVALDIGAGVPAPTPALAPANDGAELAATAARSSTATASAHSTSFAGFTSLAFSNSARALMLR
ncbi:LOW QUALITY PROTEIN: hypothetical protein CVT25_013765, partial [Psilocybe cyanescens]